jgi:hypothetical protein
MKFCLIYSYSNDLWSKSPIALKKFGLIPLGQNYNFSNGNKNVYQAEANFYCAVWAPTYEKNNLT